MATWEMFGRKPRAIWRKIVIAFVVLPVSSITFAADYQVSDTQKLILTTGDVVEPAPQIQAMDALPDVATPIFHFDAKNPTGWEFDAIDQTKGFILLVR